jgi:hypothetical protein
MGTTLLLSLSMRTPPNLFRCQFRPKLRFLITSVPVEIVANSANYALAPCTLFFRVAGETLQLLTRADRSSWIHSK